MKNRAGFTYVELSVVILVLALVVAMVTPNVQAFMRGEQDRRERSAISRMSLEARLEALSSGNPTGLSYDGASREFVITNEASDSTGSEVKRIIVPDAIEPVRFVANRTEMSPAEWKVVYYPDGTCDGGGIEMSEGPTTMALLLDPSSASGRWVQGQLPDPQTERWAAGEYERRS